MRRTHTVLLLLVLPLAFATRCRWALGGIGAAFQPRPDALEYVASAQAIAQSGRYFLQVGPLAVRPRYSPGWPLMLAAALRGGVAPQRLWGLAAACGAGLAGLLALLAAEITARRPGAEGLPVRRLAPLVAGLVAGTAWALAPVAVAAGGTTLSDEPATLLCVIGMLLPCLAADGEHLGLRTRVALALAGGLGFGLLLATRMAVAALLAVPVLIMLARRFAELRRLAPILAAWSAGCLLVPLLVCVLLLRSGLDPLHWTGYSYWGPELFGPGGHAFSWRYVLAGYPQAPGMKPASHLLFATKLLLGVPGAASPRSFLGYFWPAIGWLAGGVWLGSALRNRRRRRLAVALASWVAANVLFFASYFFTDGRFFLPPLALCTLLFGVLAGRAAVRNWSLRRAALVALVAVVAIAGEVALLRAVSVKHPEVRDLRATVAAWRSLGDRQRGRRVMQFDPLEAQAQGLLPPGVVAEIREWGELPPTQHVRRLRDLGILPAGR